MAILQEWQKIAYNEKANQAELQKFWQRYFLLEKGVYEKLLTNPDEAKKLADKEYQSKIAEALTAGVEDYLNNNSQQ